MHNKKMKVIQVPDGLISSQYREDGIKVSPKTLFLYVWLKILLTDFDSNLLSIQPIVLRTTIGWKTNVMLKNHMKILKELTYITYQDEFDNGKLQANQELEIKIAKIGSNFKQLTEKSVKEKILPATNTPDKALKLCFLIKAYTNKQFGYCWLTFEQFEKWGNLRQNDIGTISTQLVKKNLLHIARGDVIIDNSDRVRKENNKYQLLFK